MKCSCPYIPFSSFVIRAPLKPLKTALDILSRKECHDKQIMDLFNDPAINEAILLASPQLYKSLVLYFKGEIVSEKETKRIKTAAIKYFVRLSTRCTPFGLFAGVTTGNWSNNSSIELNPISFYRRQSRLDMSLSNHSLKDFLDHDLRHYSSYTMNPTHYFTHGKIRYLESRMVNKKKSYHISEVLIDEGLQSILSTLPDFFDTRIIYQHLIKHDYSKDEVTAYIDHLIDNQLFVNLNGPSVTRNEPLREINRLKLMHSIENKNTQTEKTVLSTLKQLDSSVPGESIELYEKLNEFYHGNDVDAVIQTDLYLSASKCKINSAFQKSLIEALSVLKRLSFHKPSNQLEQFKTRFLNRYDSEEIPLPVALDPDEGIGYGAQFPDLDIQPLVEDLGINNINPEFTMTGNPVDSLLFKLVTDSLKGRKYSIILNKKHLNNLEENWDDTLPTMSVLVKLFGSSNSSFFQIMAAGGSCGANLLTRFGNGNEKIKTLCSEIIKEEEAHYHNCIVSEVVHLPEFRTGNVLHRPSLRNYEIPVMSSPGVSSDYVILIKDTMVSVKQNKIVLRSKSKNKRIVPRITNAHNYKRSKIPVYRFLCDLQFQDIIGDISFSWSNLFRQFEFLPRLVFNRFVIAPAEWRIQSDELLRIINENDTENLLRMMNEWRERKKIPEWALLCEYDNELLVRFSNKDSVLSLKSSLLKNKVIVFREFLYEIENPLITGNNDCFTNEIVIPVKKKNERIC